MKTFIKKIQVAITLLSVTTVSHAYCDYEDSYSYGQNDSDCYCAPACCAPCCALDCGLSVSADLLYWRAFESGLDVCVPSQVSETITSDGRVISRFRGRGHDLHFNWSPGFRLGLDYDLACTNWDFGVYWTHFHSRAHSSHHSNNFSSSDSSSGSSLDSNHLHWKINLDVVDALARYDFAYSSCFALRPFGGVRSARIDQRLHTRSFPDSVTVDRVRNKEDFWGVGPILGLEAEWGFGCNFDLYANAAVSFLYGEFDIRLRDDEVFLGGEDHCNVHKHLKATQSIFDAGAGVRWKTCFCNDTQLYLQLGLEHHQYYNYNHIGSCYGDLSFDGVTFSARVDF